MGDVQSRSQIRARVLWPLAIILFTSVLILAAAGPAAAQTVQDPDLALFDPAQGKWTLRYSDGTIDSFFYGTPGDTPLMGDWDCDGIDTVAMYRESNGFIYLRNSNDFGVGELEFFYGIPGDIPVAGDWDNDGCDTFGIYRQGTVYLSNSLGTRPADVSFFFGIPGDRPFAGDFNGDGVDTVGLYRESTGFVYFTDTIPAQSGVAPTDNSFFYGEPSDRIVAGDWDRDGDDTVGIFRPGDSRFYLSFENRQGFADLEIPFGEPSLLPVAGNFGPSASSETWTVLVYMMADTNLEPFALDDLAEMAAVGSSSRMNILALVDRHPGYAVGGVGNLGDWEDAKVLYVARDEFIEVTEPVGEINMGDPNVLADFIEFGIGAYPADNYAVIMWDHGAGWPGMGPDETDGEDVLTLAEIEFGLAEGLARTGVGQVDFVGFDACLMATYEVASAMDGLADYMLASQELEPGHGWDYRFVDVLTTTTNATPIDLGLSLIDGYAAQAVAAGTHEAITLSLLDLGRVGEVEAGLAALSVPLATQPTVFAPVFGEVRSTTLSFGRNPDPAFDSNMTDLGLLVAGIGGAEPAFEQAAVDTLTALDAMVLAYVNGPATAEATGLSVYFPEFERDLRPEYLLLDVVTTWPDVLDEYYAAGSTIPTGEWPRFTNPDGAADYFFDVDGLNIFGTLDPATTANLTEAVVFYGVLDESDGSVIFLGEEPGEIAQDGSGLAAAIYDLTALTLSDGIDSAFAYLVLTFDSETGLAFVDIPVDYLAPGASVTEPVMLSLVVDTDGTILTATYYRVDESGTYGELAADPFGLIFPVLLNQYPDGSSEWIVTSDVGLYADLDTMEFGFEPLASGTGLYAELVVFDYAGNSDFVSMFDFIP